MSNKLCNIPAGSQAIIQALENCAEQKRLMSLGFIQGTLVSVLRAGNPFVVNIDGLSVGISRKIAEYVIVEAKA